MDSKYGYLDGVEGDGVEGDGVEGRCWLMDSNVTSLYGFELVGFENDGFDLRQGDGFEPSSAYPS